VTGKLERNMGLKERVKLYPCCIPPPLCHPRAQVECFQEMAPALVAAPTAKLATSPEDAEDAELDESALEATREADAARRALTAEGEDGEEGDELVAGAAAGGGESARRAAVASDGTTIRLMPMHSLIAFEDQMAAFRSAEADARTKVIIATNMAESSSERGQCGRVLRCAPSPLLHSLLPVQSRSRTSLRVWILGATSKLSSSRAQAARCCAPRGSARRPRRSVQAGLVACSQESSSASTRAPSTTPSCRDTTRPK
jgi:hypothetical protein